MLMRLFSRQKRRFARACSIQHATGFHSGGEFGSRMVGYHIDLPCWGWMTRTVTVAIPMSRLLFRTQSRAFSVAAFATHSTRLNSSRFARTRLAAHPTLPFTRPFSSLCGSLRATATAFVDEGPSQVKEALLVLDTKGVAGVESESSVGQPDGVSMDPESDEDVPIEAGELQEALSRPPPVHSSYLPLPWKGRLGYACLNTYLRYANPPVFCSRTCRIASILENRHPLLDPSQPAHPSKNRPDLNQAPDVARGQAYVESLGLANAGDLVKLLRWNDHYGIKFMRLSSEMFPFASHKEYGYKLAPFASDVLVEAGRVVAELGHRVSVHPGQYTQLGSPRREVVENATRDLEYHSEMLQLLRLPPQQDRDAVMILHMGGVFGDRQATLDRFRENYETLSQDIKNRLVLENDDVSWSVHDLLPICEELNIPLVLDFHHHNIIFDESQVREGTLDIIGLYDRIKATWTRKGITQKMHYSEPVSSAITKRQRRKHSARVSTLPPCDPTMDLMIEAKDKEQAVFELMRTFRLPGYDLFNDITPYVRDDENQPFKPPRNTKKNGGFVDLVGQVPPVRTVPEDEVSMGGPDRRVYWPPGMEEWLRPKKVIRAKSLKSPRKGKAIATDQAEPGNDDASTAPISKPTRRVAGSSNTKKQPGRKRKASAVVSASSLLRALAPKSFFRGRWRVFPPSPSAVKWPVPRPLFPPFLRRFPNRDPESDRGKLFRLIRVFFGPNTSRRAQLRLWNFRHETIPAVRHRAQARLYRAIIARQARLAQRSKSGKLGITELLVGRRKRLRASSDFSRGIVGGSPLSFDRALRAAAGKERAPGATPASGSMSDYGSTASSTWGTGSGVGDGGIGRERGARRKKVYEYLKAANELRQSYTAQWSAQRSGARDYNDDYLNTPGAFPDVEIARAGDEEMVIFPSYARRLVNHPMNPRSRRGSTSTIDEYRGISKDELEPGMPGWEAVEDEDAIVAVDVRGWVYAPHRGPMTRKHRLAIALARKLSGVPAPAANYPNDGDGPNQDVQLPKITEKREEEIVDTEAQSIIQKVDKGNDLAWKDSEPNSIDEDPPRRTPTTASTEPSQLSKDEISIANAHLMERIRPFLTNPMAGMAVTAFFFNEKKSQSRNILTNESGHFSLRASLPFIPTHVRVLASEELSVVKEIEVIEPTGVSLISDIDDTVKHSAITSGAKEIFRNTFVRELTDLTVEGVAEWYKSLTQMGVDIHYVSNAPWQLYPLLDRYFKTVGLPRGSFHLKQYSGMLQGIFEPAAERKKGTLEQILHDFPERKFILVGDSGEADLEVYTDLVLVNPGRILGVFIRDITTPSRKPFFEKSVDHLENPPFRNRSTPQLIDDSDTVANRPALPPRRPQIPDPGPEINNLESVDLIDLRDDDEPQSLPTVPEKPSAMRAAPVVPSKPSALRSVTNNSDISDKSSLKSELGGAIKRKPAPPVPRRRGPAESDPALCGETSEPQLGNSSPSSSSRGLAAESNNTKPASIKQPPPLPPPRRSNTTSSVVSSNSSQLSVNRSTLQNQQQPPFPPPPFRPSQYQSPGRPWLPPPTGVLRSTASNPSLGRAGTNTDSYPSSGTSSPIPSNTPPPPLPNKREELWRRRWERASEILSERGVMLGRWRVGTDMQEVSTWLVKEALQNMKRGESTPSGEKDRENSFYR